MRGRIWVLLGAALVLRVLVAATPGFAGDRLVFITWAQTLASAGPLAIYGPHVDPAVDYAPGYLYVLWGVGLAHAALGGGSATWRALLEIVPIAGDLALVALCYDVARKSYGDRRAFVLAAALAFAPPLWLDSAAFGQADSVPIVFALVALYAALDERFMTTWPSFAAALIVKPLVAVIAPVLAIANVRGRRFVRDTGIGIALAAGLAYASALPFTAARSPAGVFGFLFERYVTGVDKVPYVTQGAFSIYPLVTGFFTRDDVRFGPLSFREWGIGLVSVAIVAIAATLAQALTRDPNESKRVARTIGAAALSLLALFLFATRMHERYLLPAIVVGAPLALDDRPTAYALGWLAIAFTIDCAYTMAHFTGGAHHPLTVTLGRAVCALDVVAFGVLCQRQLRRLATA